MKIGSEIIEQIRNGNEEAFRAFYREYFPRVYKYAYRRVKVRELAEDLTSETFIKVMKSFEKGFELREGISLDVWVYAIERNVIRDWFRKNAGFSILPLEEKFESRFASLLEDPYSSAEKEAVNDCLKTALEEIPAQYKALIKMRFFRRMSIKEIASELGKTEGAVKVLQFRAIRALKKKVEDKIEDL